jgi:hypothetical protein
MSDHDIALWTFIITAIGVVVGLAVLSAAWLTIRDNAKKAKGQFWIMLRGVFVWYDDIPNRLGIGTSVGIHPLLLGTIPGSWFSPVKRSSFSPGEGLPDPSGCATLPQAC